MTIKKNNGGPIGFENKLWDAADELMACPQLKAHEYSAPVLRLIFLRYADFKFTRTEEERYVHTECTVYWEP